MICSKPSIFWLLLCTIYTGTQAADNTTISPRFVKQSYTVGNKNVFKYMSIVIEAKPKPTVYGCSYLSTGNDTLDQSICHTKISKGDLLPLKALNASDGELRKKYFSSAVAEGANMYWYIYEVPTSCWRTQEIYATIDGQNHTRLAKTVPVKHAPVLKTTKYNNTSQCLTMEFDALEDGKCGGFEYQITVTQKTELESESCRSCNERLYCCYSLIQIPSFTPLKFNGTLSKKVLNFEHCFKNDFILKPNSTYNDTSKYKEYGIYKVKSTQIQVTPQAMIGGIVGPKGAFTDVPLYGQPETTTTKTTGSPSTSKEPVKDDGCMLGPGKAVGIALFLIVLMQGFNG